MNGVAAAVPNVLVRDLDDDVLKQLKAAAKANGRSPATIGSRGGWRIILSSRRMFGR